MGGTVVASARKVSTNNYEEARGDGIRRLLLTLLLASPPGAPWSSIGLRGERISSSRPDGEVLMEALLAGAVPRGTSAQGNSRRERFAASY
jgi:hypothetical protein